MFLKRLDVVGFKSFAERVSVDFVPGVTAVVGPNGSGKSNITDAIRWVLGEQSAKSLRGSKMEDIIFAGSDTRKSLNVAEVALTLDNTDRFFPTDYSEITVTRRVYRSGESEFFINKQSCRLKDIVDLFMDSGLGREAFSIISQGRVEEILSSKSEDRRTIFEEAAGVLKYKHRKRKAEQKLNETQENLHRVEDIIHELEGQLEPLKIQASIARDYLEKKAELKEIEVALTVHEIEELHEQWEAQKADFARNSDLEIRLGAEIQKKEARLEELRDTMLAIDESVNDLQEVLLIASKDLEKLEGRKEVLKERKKNYHQHRESYKQQIRDGEEKAARLEMNLKQENQKLADYQSELSAIGEKLKQKQTELTVSDQNIEEAIENMKTDYIDLLNRQAAFRNEIRYIEEQLTQEQSKNSRLDEDSHKYSSRLEEIRNRKAEIEEKLEEKGKEIEAQAAEFHQFQQKLEKNRQSYSSSESKLYQAYQYIQQFRSKKEVLEDMQDDYSGFFQGVKEVLKARDRIPGIAGAVAELITVPKEYETAIETALGGAMQHIVIDNEKNARSAIGFLKKMRYGRATFLPMTVLKGRSIPAGQLEAVSGHPAFIGVGAELVKHEDRYSPVISNLLGNVIVTSDLKGANDLARMLNYRYRIVTAEGDVVNPGGSMTGGAAKQKGNSLLSRQRELEHLKRKLAEAEKQTGQLEKRVKSLKETISADEKRMDEWREKISRAKMDEQALKSGLREVEMEERNASERLSLYEHEMQSYQQDRQQKSEKLDKLKKELAASTLEAKELEQTIEQLTKQKSVQQHSKEALQSDVTELKVTYAEKQQMAANQENTVARIAAEQAETKELLENAKEEFILLEEEMNSNSSGEEKLEEEIIRKRREKDESVSLISNRREERMKHQQKHDDIERELKEEKRQYKQLTELLRDEEVKINRLDVGLENRLDHLRDEYALSFDAAKAEYELTVTAEEARTKVKLIKLAIEELGSVNTGAIEEYERIAERFSFLEEQRNDLMEAKETLHTVIAEMDEEMTRRFQSVFYDIREHFGTVFAELFGGGRADLLLTDPDNMLTTGVDIVAQPPGKKLQNLNLLSGGERALTAIALLFAILKVRPVPFCVLDEVEAALDDANVHRFAAFLKQFSAESQFIVITHRKGTMEEADVLYGVTMQESGVSKLVSVRLEESKQLVQGQQA
ncbi:chromosome segregation protein SMC [Bacillus marinisedimentorum]|uniref:chromosome segregation protein SMC n=1 Tax=Bacillus marinisedimentorum TaxID=1821260 RepID=UPI0007E08A71|nr:chromosome segregation protein SMC [Bacillus marinisedimentorum]